MHDGNTGQLISHGLYPSFHGVYPRPGLFGYVIQDGEASRELHHLAVAGMNILS